MRMTPNPWTIPFALSDQARGLGTDRNAGPIRPGSDTGRCPPRHPRHVTDHIAETDAIVAELERAGLITVTQREDGEPIYTLTPEGGQVSRQLAMTDDAGQGALMAGLLEDVET